MLLAAETPGSTTVGSVLPQVIDVLLLPVFTRSSAAPTNGLELHHRLSAVPVRGGDLVIHSYILRHYFECRREEKARSSARSSCLLAFKPAPHRPVDGGPATLFEA